ncbi:hypothetical protein ATJ88_0095 [Isoptericola jiangsuensis]|uniref:Uncharacterized protein n=2 Tax=Isoptericola jiangsuensis TaxID=548579 RepID=A0A2A9ESB5_9MICO|nr:hypothetical protein ATJ88_0095 [Isoptericola jiangsuensis]
MSRPARSVARAALVAAISVLLPLLLAAAPASGSLSTEPRPIHAGQARPDVTLTAAPPVLFCTIRPGVQGCTSFGPDEPGALVAILYAEPWFHGARVHVFLATALAACTARTSDDEGGGDLAGPLLALLGHVGSVETFHRCDVQLHDAFLDAGGAVSGWIDEVSDVSGRVAAFTVS